MCENDQILMNFIPFYKDFLRLLTPRIILLYLVKKQIHKS